MCSITRLYKIRVGICDSFPTTSLRNASKFPIRTKPKCQFIMILIQNALFLIQCIIRQKMGYRKDSHTAQPKAQQRPTLTDFDF